MEPRSTRDKLLAVVVGLLLFAAAMSASAQLITLINYGRHSAFTEARLSMALVLANYVLIGIGFGIGMVAFAGSADRRQRSLGLAAMLIGVGSSLLLISLLIVVRFDITNRFVTFHQLGPDFLLAVYATMLVAAAAFAANGFFKAARGGPSSLIARDINLRRGAISLAFSLMALVASEILRYAYGSSLTEVSTSGTKLIIAGYFVVAIGWIVIVRAFRRDKSTGQNQDPLRISRRDSVTAISTGVMAVGFFAVGAGSVIIAVSPESPYRGALLTATWLGSVGLFAQTAAAANASVAFFISRRSQLTPPIQDQ